VLVGLVVVVVVVVGFEVAGSVAVESLDPPQASEMDSVAVRTVRRGQQEVRVM
jgi:hypothetical protein